MKILVIPDVHLKPQMFKQATALMHQGIADRAVCLMEFYPDDVQKVLFARTFGCVIASAS